jgi:hypothetical protein
MRGGQKRVAATSRRVQATGTRSEALLAPRGIQALVRHAGLSVPRDSIMFRDGLRARWSRVALRCTH